ncbi:hypothetical protein MYSEV_157 [Mythimna separata entomopoxvirus 'L']|uniref:RING-type domain-containing protein n=1 Tax=Mythimna separata entomopoxvirus 'L' TaxID=1293572 RepID=A0A916KQF8_9POXV|nr:hypothetical protein MYSEV_157 [Mythimna separata entomopoxvirus 'L']CCU56355.1 hypothetical protein MYSEV_157 [Mythimna separata entomopoxvirus 'L']
MSKYLVLYCKPTFKKNNYYKKLYMPNIICSICLENKNNVKIYPCYHDNICLECLSSINNCIYCDEIIHEMESIV